MTLSDSLADHLYRPNHRALPDLPLVVVQGPVLSGKSTLLGELDAGWRRHAPVVRIALEEDANRRPYQVAVAVADELVRRTPVPKHMFRRLFLGVAALKPDLPHDPVQAMRALQDHLRRRDTVMTNVRNAVNGARQVIAALPQPEVPPGTGAGLAAVLPLMWLLRKQTSAWRWFAGATGSNSGIAGLVHLNRLHRIDDRRAEVDTLLLRAFLADLARAFTRWRHSDRLKHNALLLIDAADTTDAPLRFVGELLEARRIEAERSGRGDPLLVVATCGIRTGSGVAAFPWNREVIGPSGPFDVDLTPRGGAGPAPVHVVDLGHNLPREHDSGDVVDRWSRSLSGGHRWAYARMSENGRTHPKGQVVNRETLFAPLVAELAEASLSVSGTRELEQDLQILSAISPLDPSAGDAFLAALAPRGEHGIETRAAFSRRGRAQELVSQELWTGPESNGLHPIFRRAFLARLAQAGDPLSWGVVFERLAAVPREKEEEKYWQLHYELAGTGDIGPAAKYLAQLLDDTDAERWPLALKRITSAPHKGDYGTGTAQLDGREHDVADLVSALWLSRNHRGRPKHEEFVRAARALEDLTDTGLSGTLTDALLSLAADLRSRQQFLDELA